MKHPTRMCLGIALLATATSAAFKRVRIRPRHDLGCARARMREKLRLSGTVAIFEVPFPVKVKRRAKGVSASIPLADVQ